MMKGLSLAIASSVVAASTTWGAADQGYLTGTNTIELVEGESLIVLSMYGQYTSATEIYILVDLPPYEEPQIYLPLRVLHSTDLAGRTVIGPCRVMNDNIYNMFAYKINRAEVFTTPMNIITLPAEVTNDVNLVVESSPDLETWTPVYSGSAGTSGTEAYFRTRLTLD